MGRSLVAKNGRKTSLWLDSWLHNRPLSFSAPVLFDLCCEKNISVHSFLAKQGQLHFSRWLPHVLFEQWLGIINSVYNHPFVNSEDTPVWAWNKNKNFSSQSVYNFVIKENSRKHLKHVWKAKIPYKIKIFLWLVENNAILTKGQPDQKTLDRQSHLSFLSHWWICWASFLPMSCCQGNLGDYWNLPWSHWYSCKFTSV